MCERTLPSLPVVIYGEEESGCYATEVMFLPSIVGTYEVSSNSHFARSLFCSTEL